MPPSGHSSSSHSSHSSSHSSHSSSSSRSYSSHSSSSSRSYSSSSFGRSYSSSSRSPSGHSSSSRSSRPASSYRSGTGTSRPAASSVPKRPRVNQPTGFRPLGGRGSSWVYGRRHDYVYYPFAWTDTSTGTYYEKGYYDENGQRYENVAFEKNGKYENVLCHCPYCDQDSLLTLDAENVKTHSLQCPHCNGPMEIKSQLDEYAATGYTDSGTRTGGTEQPKKKRHIGLIVVGILAALGIISSIGNSGSEQVDVYDPPQQGYVTNYTDSSNVSLFGEEVYMVSAGDGAYAITSEGSGYDKVMIWSSYDDSYYDADSDCWIWCNTDVEPPVWQYWYEGISSDFGDYGWMEHEETGWYIEASAGNWIELPDSYSTEGLWYIAE